MSGIVAHISNSDGTCNEAMERRAVKMFEATQPLKDVVYTDYIKAARCIMMAIQADNGIGYVESMKYPPEHLIAIANALENFKSINPDLIYTGEIVLALAIGTYTDENNIQRCNDFPELPKLTGFTSLDDALNDFFQVM